MVKALDLKSNGNFPHRFEPCSQRSIIFFRKIFGRSWEHEPILVLASNWDWRTKDSQLLFLERTCRRQRLEMTTTTTLSKKKRRLAQAKICPRTESDSIKRSYDNSVVKAVDSKSNGNFPRTIEPFSQRSIFLFRNIFGRSWEHEPKLVLASNRDWRTKDSQVLFLQTVCRRQRLETTTTTTIRKKNED